MSINPEMLEQIQHGQGFIAALDQSGGSTPKALANYGISEGSYSNDQEMFDLVHQMRSRIITSPAFTSEYIIGAILFERTMSSKIGDKFTAEYLWQDKHIVPFLKVDNGLAEKANGVQLMKPIPELEHRLSEASRHGVFGTKMRSVIYEANQQGIKEIIDQQFELAQIICKANLVPIIEPEVDIHAADKAECEQLMKQAIQEHLADWNNRNKIMFKFTIPTEPNFYADLYDGGGHKYVGPAIDKGFHVPVFLLVRLFSVNYGRPVFRERKGFDNGFISLFEIGIIHFLGFEDKRVDYENLPPEGNLLPYEIVHCGAFRFRGVYCPYRLAARRKFVYD